MGKAIDQLLIVLAVIIGTFGKLSVHALDIGLHLKNMLESEFGFLHDGTLVTEYHHLGQIADGTFAGNGDNTGCGLLDTGQYLEHGRFARTILAHKGYAVFFIDDVRNVFEQGCGVKFDFQSFYGYHNVNEISVQDCKGNDFQRYATSRAHINLSGTFSPDSPQPPPS